MSSPESQSLVFQVLQNWYVENSKNIQQPLAVAFSAGMDSCALLDAAVKLWGNNAVIALHVHHGLQQAADDFALSAQSICVQLNVRCKIIKLNMTIRHGQSVEAEARVARRNALVQTAREHSLKDILLAQHQDDQAETFLLALLRGSGLAGLASMPQRSEYHGVRWHRPFLTLSKKAIQVYAQNFAYVHDPMNDDLRLTRSFLRHQVMPLLSNIQPQVVKNISRSAWHIAQTLHDETEWLSGSLYAPLLEQDRLTLADLRSWKPRPLNVFIRHWLKRRDVVLSTSRLDNVLDFIRNAKGGERYFLNKQTELSFHQQYVDFVIRLNHAIESTVLSKLCWQGETHWHCEAWQGCWEFITTPGKGIRQSYLWAKSLRCDVAHGKIRIHKRAANKSVKKLFQEHAIDAIARRLHYPGLLADGVLIAIAALGQSVDVPQAQGDDLGVTLEWKPYVADIQNQTINQQ